MKIKGKLVIMVLPMLVFAIVSTSYLSYLVKHTANQGEEVYYDQLYQISSTLINADRDFYQAYSALLQNIALTDEGGTNSQYVDDYNENYQQTLDRVSEVDEIVGKYEELLAYSSDGMTFRSEFDSFKENITRLADLYDVSSNQGVLSEYDQCFSETRENISNMEDLIESYAEESGEKMQSSVTRSIIWAVVVMAVCLILAGVLATYYIITIKGSLEHLTGEINVMAGKDLTQPIKVLDGKDEIAQLSKASASLREQILGMMQTFRNSSDSLNEASGMMSDNTKESVRSVQAIDTAAGELANTATQQAADASMMSEEVQNVYSITEDSIRNTNSLESACKDIENATQNGMRIVGDLTSITNKSKKAFENIFAAISGMDEKARTISGASDMISDIANQTNLLSLNASIEAARAGEAGRGFAVVADEIRQLAEQSAASVETINAMIAALSESSEEAGRQSEKVKRYVESQMKSVEETQRGFEVIVDSVNIVNEDVVKLRDINDNLGDKVHQITELVGSLAAASEENAATSQELSSTTTTVTASIMELEETEGSVSKLSDDLSVIVSDYKI